MAPVRHLIIALPFSHAASNDVKSQYKRITSFAGFPEAECGVVEIPRFKVATFDTMLEASDELGKLDTLIEGNVIKHLTLLEELSAGEKTSRLDLAMVEKVDRTRATKSVRVADYITEFTWDREQFPPNISIRALAHQIMQGCAHGEEGVRVKYAEYSELRQRVANIEKRLTGNLSVRPVGDITKSFFASDPLADSQELAWMLLVIPSSQAKEFIATYWRCGPALPVKEGATPGEEAFGVVPGSHAEVKREGEMSLYAVAVMKRFLDPLRQAFRAKKWVVRDASDGADLTKESLDALKAEMQGKQRLLRDRLRVTFQETYKSWIHLKVLRVFVEATLRFGLSSAIELPRGSSGSAELAPVFIPMVFRSLDSKKEGGLRKALAAAYDDLMKTHKGTAADDELGSFESAYPYLSLPIPAIELGAK